MHHPGPPGRPPLRPFGLHDLRGEPLPAALRYGPADVVVVAGLPGAGKSTLMSRCADARPIDSQHVRDAFRARLPAWLPYPLFRPLVRITHYARLFAALRDGGPLMIHDCGTVPLVRAHVARTARHQGRRVHLLLVDAGAAAARAGQLERGRSVSARGFARHLVVTGRTLDHLIVAGAPPPGWASAVVIGRPGAGQVHELTFGSGH